ncbi:[FeFe] hydrogenase H-cluster radical SAM maturase HydE [Mediterraneibacter glycyrrhizinilyticus]|uniref:[FeFe] hydrogenase H-cluster radical SAM maturase HydE n=1 Tax=Mediterraneibacter glycyrrhizinilyticus TaxID=342942 RepID=UPI00195FF9FB|nr:[FeFe] hydrogenase H-cluster radical SAM maturase HydE [Mediterraneibacter glycyrrhizinilyticus]MBM6751151.1 [FeFe] hydrogenase H-cluster radical SAM maturase HydE [Mediterraneibacter glycyrrhizinilyticus]
MITSGHTDSGLPVIPAVSESEGLSLIDKLEQTRALTRTEWAALIHGRTPVISEYLFARARKARIHYYGKDIYIRGLIEFTNYCRNDCYYCGIRKSNKNAVRYRLTKDQILSCCENGYHLGFRTFVLQGGEDGWFTEDRMTDIVSGIRQRFPDCAITLSIGELPRESYRRFFEAGADRYLLRHETYDSAHYSRLHPASLSASHRQKCLWYLKELGYQVGTGFMVGSPYQTAENLADDMLFLKELNPQMVGIGPFIPHHDTPFAGQPAGTLELTVFMLGLIRLMLPKVLLPATTALGTIAEDGREQGILAGANVVMPNLSPAQVRENYLLYDNKLCTGDEAAESLKSLNARFHAIGYHIAVSRGDSLNTEKPVSSE